MQPFNAAAFLQVMQRILSIPLYTGRRCNAVSGGFRPVFSGTEIEFIFAMTGHTLVLDHNQR